MLKQKYSLIKLREELERKREKLCFSYRKFEHLVRNCRNSRKEEEREKITSQNKFEVLLSRVMQCGVEERTIRRQEVVEVECFKCGEKGHKCRVCPLWRKIEGK